MGCPSCGRMSNIRQIQRIVRRVIKSEDCIYDIETLEEWIVILKCVKNNNLYTFLDIPPKKLNSYIGIVKSAINYSSNPCYFILSLEKIKIVIDKIKIDSEC